MRRTGLDSRSLFQPLFRLALACISERVRFRDFNWPGGIPLRGLYEETFGRYFVPRPGDGWECALSFLFLCRERERERERERRGTSNCDEIVPFFFFFLRSARFNQFRRRTCARSGWITESLKQVRQAPLFVSFLPLVFEFLEVWDVFGK